MDQIEDENFNSSTKEAVLVRFVSPKLDHQPNDDTNKTEIPHTSVKTGWRRYGGLIFALLASFCFPLSGLISKVLTEKNYHPFNIGFWRYQGATTVVPCWILYLKLVQNHNVHDGICKDNGKTIFFLVVRGTIGFLGMTFFIFSLQYLKLADAAIIASSTPIAVTLFARIFLGEPCGIVPIIAALIAFSGVAILTRPPLLTGADNFDENTLIGALFALLAMFSLTSAFVVVRYLRKVHLTLPLLFFGYVSTLESGIICIIFGYFEVPRTLEDWLLTIAGALIILLAQICMSFSLKYEQAGPVALVRTFDVVFAFIFQLMFLGVIPDGLSLAGALVITLGIIITTFRKWLTTLKEKHPARSIYWFMLK